MNKSRSAGGKPTPKKIPIKTNRLQNKKIPVEKKENLSFTPNEPIPVQPCCSHSSAGSIASPKNRSTDLPSNRSTKTKKVIDKTNKGEKSKINPTTNMIKGKSNQLHKDKKTKKTDYDEAKRIQLREICFVKYPEGGKKVIAKYKTEKSCASDNNLIVAWDSANTQPQVFSNQVFPSEAGPSKQGSFRVHNFRRSISRTNRGQRMLRRLSAGGTDNPSKISKIKKRKIIKNKVV